MVPCYNFLCRMYWFLQIYSGRCIYGYKRKSKADTCGSQVDTEFQNIYRDFYQMRRFYSDEFARKYFRLMEQIKGMSGVTFKM